MNTVVWHLLACALLAIVALSISRFYSRGVLVCRHRHRRMLHVNSPGRRADEAMAAANKSILRSRAKHTGGPFCHEKQKRSNLHKCKVAYPLRVN
jgi:hypothetical protein